MNKEGLTVYDGAAAIAMAKAKSQWIAQEVQAGKLPHVYISHNRGETIYCRVVPRGEKKKERWFQKMGLGSANSLG